MNLFQKSNGQIVTSEDALEKLKKVGASDCDILFIHSDVMFGKPDKSFSRTEYMEALLFLINELGVKNIIMPAFTYSFCNGEDFDRKKSKSYMGSFSEFFRKQEGVFRTRDPLLSFCIRGEIAKKFENIKSTISLGKGSCYDVLNYLDNVKYLFLGADIADCWTYLHYVERMLEVPYRFDMPFEGKIIDNDGKETKEKWCISTQCGGVKLKEKFDNLKEYMINKGRLHVLPFGDAELSCISQQDGYISVSEVLSKDINFLLEKPFVQSDLTYVYVMAKNGKKVTHC